MSYSNEQLLTTNLILNSKDLTNDIDNTIKYKLKSQIEGKCHEDGYIIEDSVSIIKRSMGKVITNNGKSEIKYLITYKARLISPSEGDEFTVYISNINKMGVLSYIKLGTKETENSEDSPLIIMIPRDYFTDSSRNIEDLTIGQTLNVSIVGCRIKYLSDKIQAVAKPLE
tara:strand:- start:352 stop:861 length:510 start_codon:yes stop_codon:yes gene_type:complete